MLLSDDVVLRRASSVKVRGEWPVEKKIEVVTKFLALGNLRLVAELSGISYDTIRDWQKTSWWKDMENEIRVSRNIQQDSKLTRIIDKALDSIEDRIENGEHVFDQRTGQVVRRPVALRDVNTTANTLMQRQAILEKMGGDNNINQTQKTITEQLAMLATEFAKFNNRHKKQAQTIEYTEEDNIKEEE